MKNLKELAVVLFPMILGLSASRICPNVGQGEKNNAQPPGWVFGVVWTTLYLCIGYAWMISRRNKSMSKVVDTVMIINMIFINSWIWFYGCKDSKKMALWTFIPSIATAIMAMIVVYSATNSWWPSVLLAPYISWLIFASQLNFAIVQ